MSEELEIIKNPAFTEEQLANMCGILPLWAVQAPRYNNSFKEALIANYPYYVDTGMGERITVDEDGTMHHPDDPPLKPLLELRAKGNRVFFYEYAFVVAIEDGKVWATRMD